MKGYNELFIHTHIPYIYIYNNIYDTASLPEYIIICQPKPNIAVETDTSFSSFYCLKESSSTNPHTCTASFHIAVLCWHTKCPGIVLSGWGKDS